ncbi:hypothetical protein BV911_18560 [Pseudoruegeria sp. SK021]|nr:hypothetical protein BV911_18560 [Pseudoruegeria sp. SK021]
MKIPGNFENRNVLEDLNKTIRFDHDRCFIVFDFIDDRFPVGRIGDSYFTYNFLVDKQSPDTFSGAERIPHFLPKNRDMVKLAAKKFFETHEGMFLNNIIILHETSLNVNYDGLGFEPSRLQLLNDHLDFLHDHLRAAWKIDHSVSSRAMLTSPQATPADHRWGHSPFHYFEKYNSSVNKQLSYIMDKTITPTRRHYDGFVEQRP